MAEIDGGATQVATAEPTTSGVTEQPISLDDIEEVVDRVTRARVDSAFTNLTGRITSLEQLRGPLETLLHNQRRADAIMNSLAKGEPLSDEQLQNIDLAAKAEQAEARQRTAQAALDAALKAPKGTTHEELVEFTFNNVVGPHLFERAQTRGLTWGDVQDKLSALDRGLSTKADPTGLLDFEKRANKVIDEVADMKLKRDEPPPGVPGVTGAAVGGADESLMKRLGRGEYLSPEEMTRAARLRAGGYY